MSIFRSMLATTTLAFAGPAMCQTYFQKTYGKFSDEYATAVVETSDGNIMLGGSTFSCTTIPGTNDIHLVKCDRYGNVLWSRHYFTGTIGTVKEMIAAPDGGVVITGNVARIAADGTPLWGWSTDIEEVALAPDSTIRGVYSISGSAPGSFGIVHFDLSGDTILHRLFTGIEDCYTEGIRTTTDGGTVIVGTGRVTPTSYGAFILKLDATGDLLWATILSALPDDTWFRDVVSTPDGGFLAVGAHGDMMWHGSPLVVRFNSIGDTLWTRLYSPEECDLFSVAPTGNGYLASSQGVFQDSLSCVIQIDDDGNMLRRIKPFNGPNFYDLRLAGLSDGDVVICGTVEHGTMGKDEVLMVLDGDLGGLWCTPERPLWDTISVAWTLGTFSLTDIPHEQLTDLAPQYDACIVMTDTLCTSGDMGLVEASASTISIGPNPTSSDLHVSGLRAGEVIELHDASGREVLSIRVRATSMELNLPAGLFLLTIVDAHGLAVFKQKIACTR